MFQLLPWTEGKFHILMDGALFGSTYMEDDCTFIRINANDESDSFAEIEFDDLLQLHGDVKRAYQKLIAQAATPTHTTQQLGQSVPARGGPTPIKVPAEKGAKKKSAETIIKEHLASVATVISKSKWAKCLDGQEHTLTLKQTGYKDFAGFRSNMFSFTKKHGYSFSSTVKGKNITFTCTKNS